MAYIVEQINTILAQEQVRVRLFISVDQSTDGTEELLARWDGREPRITLLPLGRRFGGAGPNFYRLLREVSLDGFDYLSFADQDDIWHPDKLRRAHECLRLRNAQGYSSNVTAFWPNGASRVVDKAHPQRQWDFLFESAGPGCTYVFSSPLAKALQQLVQQADTNLKGVDYHDWLSYAFARTHGFAWFVDAAPSMQYRQHASNQIGVNSGARSFALRVRKVLNGYAFQQALRIAQAVGVDEQPLVRRGLRGGRSGYLWLALQCGQCRRKPLDRLWFFLSCVFMACKGPVHPV